MNKNTLLHINKISLKIDGNIILNNFELILNQSDKAAIKAASGKGKTSILNAVLGFIPVYKGEILLSGVKLSGNNVGFFRKNIAWLPQMFDTAMTVEEFIKMPFLFKNNRHLKFDLEKIYELYDKFDLDKNIHQKNMNEISGGEKQRIGLITALLLDRKILILDEPVSAIDNKLKEKITDYLFAKPELTILSSSHDDIWLNRCNKIIEI